MKKKVFCTFILTMLCSLSTTIISCRGNNPDIFPSPRIEAGMAKLSGKLIGFERPDGSQHSLEIRFMDIVTVTPRIIKIEVEDDGGFYLEIPVESDITWATAIVDDYDAQFVLTTRQQTRLELGLDEQGEFHAGMDGFVKLTDVDMVHFMDVVGEILTNPGSETAQEYSIDHQVLIDRTMTSIERIRKMIYDDSFLSKAAKSNLSNGFRLFYLNECLLDYRGIIRLRYFQTHPEEEWDNFVAPEEPGMAYYKFLSRFNLNDPQYLLTGELYSRVLQKLFTIDALGILPIGETPVAEWLAGVRTTLSDVVGFSEGQFYDLLISNAYGRQFEMETRPLSEKQIANIKDYFRDDKVDFADILMRRNAEIEKLAVGVGDLTVHEAIDVANEKLLDTILAPHKGKVVVVDFWATWCQPCVAAMKEIRKLKSESGHEGIAFVYLTGSSDKKLWGEMIKGIGGDHYFLNDAQWEYLMDHFGFEYIPSYAIFGIDGTVHEKFESYPGNDKFRETIAKTHL